MGLCKLDKTNGWGEPPHVPWDAGLLFNIPQSLPTVKGAIHRPAVLQNPGSFLKQDVCMRPPSPQINNPQNLISGGRVEALESHYFHIPYPGAFGLLRECGRPGAGKALGCGGNLRPWARLQGEMSQSCISLGSLGWRKGLMPRWGRGTSLTCWCSRPYARPYLCQGPAATPRRPDVLYTACANDRDARWQLFIFKNNKPIWWH